MDIYNLKSSIDTFRIDVERNGQFVDKIVNDMLDKYSKDLDDLMSTIKSMLFSDEDWTTAEFESVALKLPCLLYSISSFQEKIGIRVDISKSLNSENFNRIYKNASGTIVDRKAFAELETQADTMVTSAITHAYKTIQGKVTAAYEMLNSVKKILNARVNEKQ